MPATPLHAQLVNSDAQASDASFPASIRAARACCSKLLTSTLGLRNPMRSEDLGCASHEAPPASAIISSAAPRGVLAWPRLSRINALRIVSRGTPCCRAIEQTTAESQAAAPASDPARWLVRKISANSVVPGK